MLCIYGDSHGRFSFKNLILPHKNYHNYSITMFRIGRDNIIINYDKSHHTKEDTICLVYGEVDCRCHIRRQILMGRDEDAVIQELVNNYFRTIRNNIIECKKIIVVSHNAFLEILLKIIFKTNILPKGDMKNGNNCYICYCTLKNNLFSMVSPKNTEHLGLI